MHVAAELAVDGAVPVWRSVLGHARQTISTADEEAVVGTLLERNPDFAWKASKVGQEGTPLPEGPECTCDQNALSAFVSESLPHMIGAC